LTQVDRKNVTNLRSGRLYSFLARYRIDTKRLQIITLVADWV
jgi:hypothetical protein